MDAGGGPGAGGEPGGGGGGGMGEEEIFPLLLSYVKIGWEVSKNSYRTEFETNKFFALGVDSILEGLLDPEKQTLR